MELTQESVEKLDVGQNEWALFCKGLLLDAIEAGDKLEARIKELESIPHTDNTAVIEALQRDKDDLIALNEKRIARIKELEAENERLKAELKQTEAQDKIVIDGLRKENERLKKHNDELVRYNGIIDKYNDELEKENAKLECLALHLLREYCFAQGTIISSELEDTDQPIEEDVKMIHKINIRDRWGEYFADAYYKAKKALSEGSNV